MTRRWSLTILTWALLATMPALAQADEGPLVIANREKHPYLTLDPFHGSVGVTGLYQLEHNQSGGQRSSASDTLFTQDLTLATSGAIISQNLATWSASGTVSLNEEWTSGNLQSGSETGIFYAYDLQLSALNNTAFPFSAYAQRGESFVNRAFAALLRDTTSGYGASFHYNNALFPSTLSISHTTTTQSSLGGENQFTIDQNELDFGTSFQPFERQMVSVNYHFATATQSTPGSISNASTLQGVTVAHNWSIDPASHYTLSQVLDYSQQSGNFPFTQLRLTEQLRLRHTDTLESALNYSFDKHDYATNSTTRHSVVASVMHRLYESLYTTARVGGSMSQNSFSAEGQSSDATTTSWYSDVAFNYQKKMYMGRLGAHLSLGYNQDENSAIGVSQQVLNDVETFIDPQPIILTRQGVNASSIAVFDATGTRRLVEGIDYEIRTVGHTVHIERLVGGAIDTSDSVRLNYTLDPLPGFTSTSTTLSTGLNYLFDEGWFSGLNIFGRYSQVDQSISPTTAGLRPDSVRDTVVGAEYRIWKLTFRAEDQNHDSTLAPHDSLRFSARYDDRLGDRTTLSLNAAQNFTHFPLEDTQVSLTTVDGRLQYQVAQGLRTILTARWRNNDDSRTGTSTGIEEQLELRWKIRQTDIFGLVRHTALETRDNNSSSLFFQFGVTRNF